METWLNKAQQTTNLGMILQDRWYLKQIPAPQTQMTPFLKTKMQGDDPEKVRK